MLPGNKAPVAVLAMPAEAVLAWVWEQVAAIECSEDWQILAYGIGIEVGTNSSLSEHELVAWATAAVLIYDRMGEICPERSERSYYAKTGMSLRALVINKVGPQPGHLVQDPAILEDWFFRRLDLPYEEAVAMSNNASNLSTEDFLRISTLKDRVRLMKSVQPQQAFRRTAELDRWYQLLGSPPG